MQTVIWGTVSVAESRLTIRRLMIAAGIGRKTMNEKLRPCPFCGGEACIEDISELDDMDVIWMIVCDECGGSASFGMDGCDATKDEAITAWNRRYEK